MQHIRYLWNMRNDDPASAHCQTAIDIAYQTFVRDERLAFVEHVLGVLNESRSGTRHFDSPAGAFAEFRPKQGSPPCCSSKGSCFYIDLCGWSGMDIHSFDSHFDQNERLRMASLWIVSKTGIGSQAADRSNDPLPCGADHPFYCRGVSVGSPCQITPTAQPRGSPGHQQDLVHC